MIVKRGETRAAVGAQSVMDRAGVVAVDAQCSGETLMRAAGLEWDVEKVQAYFPVGDERDGHGCEFRPVARRFALVRTDSKTGLGTVGRGFRPLQNRSLFHFGDRLIEASGGRARWDQAGSMNGGRRVFATISVDPSPIEVHRFNGAEDLTRRHLLLTNQHDGQGGAIGVVFMAYRLNCSNQISGALRNRSCVRIPHTARAETSLEALVGTLSDSHRYFEEYGEVAQRLADQPMSEREFSVFTSQVLTGLDDPQQAADQVLAAQGRSKALLESKGAELLRLFRGGLGNFGHDRFDALNAVTEWIDHQHQRMARYRRQAGQLAGAVDRSAESAYFGQGARVKARALTLLR